MAITFDPINKIIQLDSFNVSEREIWTAFVNWASLDDNLRYGVGMTQIGGVPPIPLYIYLELGWRVRPKEAHHTLKITGNLLTAENDDPVVATVGNWQVLIQMETPVKGVLLPSVGGGSGGGGSGGGDFTPLEKAGLVTNTARIPFMASDIEAIKDALSQVAEGTGTITNITVNW